MQLLQRLSGFHLETQERVHRQESDGEWRLHVRDGGGHDGTSSPGHEEEEEEDKQETDGSQAGKSIHPPQPLYLFLSVSLRQEPFIIYFLMCLLLPLNLL